MRKTHIKYLIIGIMITVGAACMSHQNNADKKSMYFCYAENSDIEKMANVQTPICVVKDSILFTVCDSLIKYLDDCSFSQNKDNVWFQICISSSSDTTRDYDVYAYIWQKYSKNFGSFYENSTLSVFNYADHFFFLDKGSSELPFFERTDSVLQWPPDTNTEHVIYAFKAGNYALSQHISALFRIIDGHCFFKSVSKKCAPM